MQQNIDVFAEYFYNVDIKKCSRELSIPFQQIIQDEFKFILYEVNGFKLH